MLPNTIFYTKTSILKCPCRQLKKSDRSKAHGAALWHFKLESVLKINETFHVFRMSVDQDLLLNGKSERRRGGGRAYTGFCFGGEGTLISIFPGGGENQHPLESENLLKTCILQNRENINRHMFFEYFSNWRIFSRKIYLHIGLYPDNSKKKLKSYFIRSI